MAIKKFSEKVTEPAEPIQAEPVKRAAWAADGAKTAPFSKLLLTTTVFLLSYSSRPGFGKDAGR